MSGRTDGSEADNADDGWEEFHLIVKACDNHANAPMKAFAFALWAGLVTVSASAQDTSPERGVGPLIALCHGLQFLFDGYKLSPGQMLFTFNAARNPTSLNAFNSLAQAYSAKHRALRLKP